MSTIQNNNNFWKVLLLGLILSLCLFICAIASAQTLPVQTIDKGIQQVPYSQIDSIFVSYEFDNDLNKVSHIRRIPSGTRFQILDFKENRIQSLVTSSCDFCETDAEISLCANTVAYSFDKLQAFYSTFFGELFTDKSSYSMFVNYDGGSVNGGMVSQINSTTRKECSFVICNHETGHAILRTWNEPYGAHFTLLYRLCHESTADLIATFSESWAETNLEERRNLIKTTEGRVYRRIGWRHYKQSGGYHNQSITLSWVYQSLMWGANDRRYFDGTYYDFNIQPIGKTELLELLKRSASRYGRDASGWQPETIFDIRDIIIEESQSLEQWQQNEVIEALYAVGLADEKQCPLNYVNITGYKGGNFQALEGFTIFSGALLVDSKFEIVKCE